MQRYENMTRDEILRADPAVLLPISLRARNVLRRGGINTVEMLLHYPEASLLSLRGCGEGVVADLRTAIEMLQPVLKRLAGRDDPAPPRCGTCRYYEDGQCHIRSTDGDFPYRRDGEWCGEYSQAKEGAQSTCISGE
jgi:hypothetical protein